MSDRGIPVEGLFLIHYWPPRWALLRSLAELKAVGCERLAHHGQCGSRRQRFGRHLDGVARALLEADPATRAQIEGDSIAQPAAEAGNRLLRTGRVAIVAFEAVAAGQAALCFIASLALGQPGDHLLKSAHPFRRRTRSLGGRIDIAEHWVAQHLERYERRLHRFDVGLAAEPLVDVPRGELAVPDRDRHGPLTGHH